MEGNKKSLWVVGIVVVIILIIIGFTSNGKSKETGPIKIGFVGPLTGDAASIGQNEQVAVALAVEEVNKAGGVNGRPIEVIYEDGKCTNTNANAAASKLINMDKVPVILGGVCSGETMAFTDIAEKSKTVVLSPCSSNPAITNSGDYIFRNYPSDNYQGSFNADYIYNKLGKKNVAILYIQTDYGTGIRGVFVDSFKKLGGVIVADESITPSSKDVRSQLTKIKASNPDIIYFLGMTEDAITGIKQARQLGINTPFFGADSWGDAKIWSTLGQAGEGSMYSHVATPLTPAFTAAMKTKIGTDNITICSPEAYDGLKLLAQVMNKVGTDSEKIKNELYKTVYTGGVSAGKIQFDSNGDMVGADYSIEVVHNSKTETLK